MELDATNELLQQCNDVLESTNQKFTEIHNELKKALNVVR